MRNTSRYNLKTAVCLLALTAASGAMLMPSTADAQVTFRNINSGAVIDFSFGKKGEETEAVKHFMATAENLYNNDEDAIRIGEDLYMTACSGCHGHHAEGKLGPALGDTYWTYPSGRTDKGFFEIIYDGARAMMGPQRNQLTKDEILKVMAWVRSIYWGDAEQALWLTEEERENFTPAPMPEEFAEALKEFEKRQNR